MALSHCKRRFSSSRVVFSFATQLEFCDVISFNRHYGWNWYPGQPNLIAKALEEDLRGLHHVFGKPVLMAEYGSSGVAGRHKVTKRSDVAIMIIMINTLFHEFVIRVVGDVSLIFVDYLFIIIIILCITAEAVVALYRGVPGKKKNSKNLFEN